MKPVFKQAATVQLAPGSRVTLCNLKSKPELNETDATCLAFDMQKMRWQVKLDQNGEGISVKMDNLRPILAETLSRSGQRTTPVADEKADAEAVDDAESDDDVVDGLKLPQPVEPKEVLQWATESTAEQWVQRLRENEKEYRSFVMLPSRTFTDQDAEKVFGALKDNESLEEICIAPAHKLTKANILRLREALPTASHIRLLQIGGAWFDDDLAQVLVQGVKDSHVKVLDVGASPNLTAEGATLFAKLDLEKLGLAGCNLAEGEDLQITGNIEHLEVSSANLQVATAEALAAWAASAAAKKLVARGNLDLGADGVKALFSKITSKSGLTDIDLEEAAAGDHGCAAIAQALEDGLPLDTLNCSNWAITVDGAGRLAMGLSKLATRRFKSLKMGGNKIEDEGLAQIAKLGDKVPLELDVGANEIDGMAALRHLSGTPIEKLSLAKSNCKDFANFASFASGFKELKELELVSCSIPPADARAFVRKLDEEHGVLPKLEVLVIGGNDLDDSEGFIPLCERVAEKRGTRVIWK